MVVHDIEVCTCQMCYLERVKTLPCWDLFPHPPTCDCPACCEEARRREKRLKEETTLTMRSNKPRELNINVIRGRAEVPAYLNMFQRHFEKACPTVIGSEATLTAPVDMLGMLLPASMVNSVESIEVIYKRSSK